MKMEIRPLYAGKQTYPRNAWYVAAFVHELSQKPLARVFLDTPVVLYRTADGEAVALHDRCPHRGMPLSMGTLVNGELLQCGYHGIEFRRDGRCVRVPSQTATPSSLDVHRYPLVQKWQWLWIWVGDAEKADPALIPDHHWLGLEREGYYPTAGFTLDLHANFQYMHDNLLDSSHFSYLHAGLLDGGELAGAKFWMEDDGRILRLGRDTPDVRFPPPVANYFRVNAGHGYNRRMVTEATPPCISIGKQTLRDATDPDAQPVELYAINALTPASARQTYVFHVQITSFDAHWTQQELDNMRYIVVQDQIALEAIQKRYDEFGDEVEISVRADAAGIRLRRMISAMINAELTPV